MKRLSAITAGLLVIALMAVGCAGRSGSGSGWVTLLDGSSSSLNNWTQVGDANWRSEDGVVVADKGRGGFLLSKSSYTDFQIKAEFWADHTTNSGIFMRISDPQKITDSTSYEANIYDRRPEPAYGTGAIVNFARVSPHAYKAGGRWNTYVITARGTTLTVELNGVQTVKIQDSKFGSGPFALQFANGPRDTPGGAIKWRKVQIRQL